MFQPIPWHIVRKENTSEHVYVFVTLFVSSKQGLGISMMWQFWHMLVQSGLERQ